MKNYTQAWDRRLYKTQKSLDLEGRSIEWKTKDRISDLEEAGADLEIYKERTEKEIMKITEREIEQHKRKQTKNMERER
jgi:hypothetical protein